MHTLEIAAPAFVRMAHEIVWCTLATVDRKNRPRSRIVHPIWEWDGKRLTGWVGTQPTRAKRSQLEHSGFASCCYWSPAQDTCVADCRAELVLDEAVRRSVWERFRAAPPPLGCDGTLIPMWKEGPASPAFAVLRLEPWRLHVFPAVFGRTNGAEGEIVTWRER